MSPRNDTLPPDEYPSKSKGYPEPSIPAFERFREVVDNPHSYARDWKERNGGPVIAFFCTYAPREVLYAGGMLPIRPYGGNDPDDIVVGDEHHFRKLACPFSRDVLAQGLLGRYDYVDGIILASTCFHMRQTYHGWEQHVNDEGDFAHYFVMPHGTHSEGGHQYLPGKLRNVKTDGPQSSVCPHAPAEYLEVKLEETKAAVEEYTGEEITEADLREAIEVYDRNRKLLHELYEYRALDDPPISGLEAMEIVKAGHVMDPVEHNALLEDALADLEAGNGDPHATDYRLMLVTSENDDRDFMHLVEENIQFDATVVIEESCVGTRDFWNTVERPGGIPFSGEASPLLDVARRYAARPPCPNKDWGSRGDQIRELATDWDVDGALIVKEKLCDLHEREIPYEEHLLEEELDIPALTLESDEGGLPAGQFKTRVEAFVEQLQSEELDALF